MPTGYTAGVQSGEITELCDFVLRCARNFGALITLRDEPMGAPIPDEFKPTEWNARQLVQAELHLNTVRSWDDTQADQQADSAYTTAVKRYEEGRAEIAEQNARYAVMLAKVERWNPPTEDHQGLKKFMRDQLEESMNFDSYTLSSPVRMSGEEFKASEIEKAEREMAYHTKAQREEDERTAGRNAWVRALRESLAALAATEPPSELRRE